MIVVTVELWPFGYEGEKKLLGKAIIVNTGSGSPTKGNYGFTIEGMRGRLREGWLADFPRQRLLVWDLLYRVLHQAFGARNKKEEVCP